MMEFNLNNIFQFTKSFNERFKEFQDIFYVTVDNEMSIQERWSYYLEISVVSCQGIKAYWNVLRKDCESLGVEYPKVIFVQMDRIDYSTHTAEVVILSNDDESVFRSTTEKAPLKDLYVTKIQDSGDNNYVDIAECFDQLRIFYHHIWWPWEDIESNLKPTDWILNNLETRLQLYYDKLENNVHCVTGKTIKKLLDKNLEIYYIFQDLYSEGFQEDSTEKDVSTLNDLSVLCNWYKKLHRNHFELNMWQISETRYLWDSKIREYNQSPSTLLVLDSALASKAILFLKYIKNSNSIPKRIKLISQDLQECLTNYCPNDVIVLTPGEHWINDREYFDSPITITGTDTNEDCVIGDKRAFWFLFQSLAQMVKFEKLTFQLRACKSIFIVKKGELILDKVNFENCFTDEASAIYVGSGAKLKASNCQFLDFGVAIVCLEGSSLHLNNCKFINNTAGLQFTDDVSLSIKKCNFKTLSGSAFIYEPIREEFDENTKSLNFLKELPLVEIDDVQVENEMKVVEII